MVFAFRDRRVRKRFFRGLWIIRIGNACKENGISYSKFMSGLKKQGIDLDRKVLAHLAALQDGNFKLLVEKAKSA